MLCLKCQKEGDSFLVLLDYHISLRLVTPAGHWGRAEHRTLLQTAQKAVGLGIDWDWARPAWTPPTADVH